MGKTKPQQLLIDYIISNQENYYRLAYSYVKNRNDALDIVHDSICKAMTTRHTPHKPEEIKPWFYRVVVNTALDFLRKQKSFGLVGEDALELYNSAEDTYEDLDLSKALDSLSPNYRSIIVLRYFEDLKIEDIAAILGENVNTIKTRLYSALKKLRLHLDNEREEV
ncbi:MAG: RNA polymerase sigma factor [Syntrophomonadaceae bacterium]|nr:RNA polymerase sigma factor [Syntrophomonadaceae bacterium]